MIYEPSEDSFLLEKEVRKYSKGKKVLEIGSGSGIQAKAALNSGAVSILASDINNDAVELLKKEGINAIKSDLFSKIKGRFDLIIFNPPYLPQDEREDEESGEITSGGEKGDEIILRFLSDLKEHLNKKGVALIVLSSLTPKKRILEILAERGLSKRVIARKKLFMEELEVWELKLD